MCSSAQSPRAGKEAANKAGVRVKLLLSPNPGEESSGGAGEVPSGPSTEPTAVPTVTPPAGPAAIIIATGEVTEESLKLKAELETERQARKKVEQDHASVTDEFARYKDATEARAVPVKPGKVKESAPAGYRFLKRR